MKNSTQQPLKRQWTDSIDKNGNIARLKIRKNTVQQQQNLKKNALVLLLRVSKSVWHNWVNDLCDSSFMLTLQETRSSHGSMNIPKIKFIAYILHFILDI